MAAPIPCASMNASISVSSLSMSLDYRCVITHRQGVTKPSYDLIARMCDDTRMKNQAFPIEAVRTSIRRLMEERGDKPQPVAAARGRSDTGIRDIFLEKTKSVGGPKLAALARHYGVSVDDIMAGTATTEGGDAPAPIPEGAIPVTAIPVVGEIAAGNWREAVQRSSMVIPAPLPSMPPQAFALEVSGDSMDLLVEDGAMIIVDPKDTTFFHKRYYAVLNEEGETTFKQYLGEPPRLVPCSSNPAHSEIPLGGQPVTVIGRIIWRSARM